MTTEPTTKSGREHVDHLDSVSRSPYSGVSFPRAEDDVIAIEREARAGLLDELEAAVRGLPDFRDRDDSPWPWVTRSAVLALIQQHREGNP